jgi:DNA-binding SARP family transcriptional activator
MPSRLRLLGPPRLESDQTSELPLDRPASLGYYLAHRADWVRRSELAYLYSPEADEASAFNNLTQADLPP